MKHQYIVSTFTDNERLRQLFADKSNSVGPWLESQLETVGRRLTFCDLFLQVVQIGMGGRGSLETAIQALQETYSRAHTYKGNLDELERVNQEMQVR